MTVSPDQLDDFIQGTLAPTEASEIAEAIARDPELSAYVEDQKALKSALASPVFEWLKQAQAKTGRHGPSWIPAGAMACGIALGVLLAASFGIGTDLRGDGSAPVAQGELAQALSTALSGDEGAGRASGVRVGPSFWSKNAAFCRGFETRGNAASAFAGIACREAGAWRIVAGVAVAPADRAGGPLVAASLPQAVREILENLIVGQMLDPDAERQARSQGWRAR